MTTNTDDLVFNCIAPQGVIEKSNINSGSRSTYYNKLINLILFFFDREEYKDLIRPDLIPVFDNHQVRDDALLPHQASKRKHLRAAIKESLRKMKRNDKNSCPLKLTSSDPNEKVLNYEAIVKHMETKKKIEKVNHKLAIEYRKAVKALNPDDDGDTNDPLMILDESEIEENGEIHVAVRQEFTTYDGIRSAIAHLYTATNNEMNSSLKKALGLYVRGSKRLNLMAKQMLGLDLTEGKRGMDEKVYRRLCQILFQSDKAEHVFAHLFFMLDW